MGEKPRTGDPNPARGAVRIISGQFRGRRLPYALDPGLRPMKDRTREALFNLVQDEVAGRHALDLFAGTGALGLEALSRGAARATFWERRPKAAESIRKTLADWDLRSRGVVITHDTLDWFRQGAPLKAEGGWLVFCSPPYDLFVEAADAMLASLDAILRLAPPTVTLIVESDARFDPRRLPQSLDWDIRNYPPAVLAVGRR